MSRICFLVDDLRPRLGDTAAPNDWWWVLAEALAERGDEVTLLHAGNRPEVSSIDLANAATRAGAQYLALGSFRSAFDVPLFPAAEIHRRAHDVAAALRELQPDHCCVLDQPTLAAIAIELRHVRAAFATTSFSVVRPERLRETARLQQEVLPSGGREEIIHDYLERRAIGGADVLIATESDRGADGDDWTHFEASQHKPSIEVLRRPTSLRDEAVADWQHTFQAESKVAAPALPKVSVCMPYYEQPQFLEAALASLAQQTRPPHELIVMDDGSKSAAAQAAFTAAEQKYAARGWKFLRQPNAGPAAARNRMVALATGDAVLFCDADNRFRPNMVETLATALTATNADCVTCAFQTFTDSSSSEEDRGYVFAPLSGCVELGLVENVLGDTNFLVRKSVFTEQGGFTAERLADEDWLFLLQLLLRGGRLETVPSVLFDYRRMETSRARRQGEFASASITLAPVLAQTPPAWRRLWPHLVAAIRNPKVATLEHQLEAIRLEHQARIAEVHQKIAAVQLELEQTSTALRRSKWEAETVKNGREQAQRELATKRDEAARFARQAEGLRMERDRLAQDIDRLRQESARLRTEFTSELRVVREERAQTVAQLTDKVERMQQSWSWRLMAPLRSVRRAIIDPLRRPKPAALRPHGLIPEPTAPASDAAVVGAVRVDYAIDEPADAQSAPVEGVIRGWCLFEGKIPPAAVRVSAGGQTREAELHARDDVAAAHGVAADVACGFQAPYALPPGIDHPVVIEAQNAQGNWLAFHRTTLKTTDAPRGARDYAAWVREFGTVTLAKAAALRERLKTLPAARRPLISVVMPVHNTPERWLRRAIESVREQIYERWELCIADDASSTPHVRALLEAAQAADSRVKFVSRPQNGHISAASNSALELAQGEFVALLDHDDEIPPDALAEMVLALATQPADVAYSDEDKIDEAGRRSSPYFKPDFLPDLLLGQNCISHLALYRTELMRQVGGFRVGFEGSQDWDLALRVIDATTPDRVIHVPKVLYHWRTIAGSTAVAVSAKNYSVDSARRALLEHFQRRQIHAGVRPVPGDHWQIVYPLPSRAPLVTIIIPTRDRVALLRTCIGSILARTEYPRYEILIANNGSAEPETKAFFQELSQEAMVRVVDVDGPFNFSAINNFAVRHAEGSVLCFLNNDIEVITGRWLDEMVSHALRSEIGAVGGMLYYPDNTIQHAGVVLGLGGVANHAFLRYPAGTDGYMNRARLAQNYSAVTAACLVVRRDTFEKVGGFNERDLAVAFNDIDLCLRIRALGLRNLWTPFAELYHHESASRGNDNAPEHQARFVREIEYMRKTWGPLLDRDPAYNPNLSLDLLGWQLAWPPRA